ncbi:hypothetical protein AMATHDRAFT_47252 [Amanita thiersii Skay4041]|uniref:YTH domain-containing protein n=1 Tax=Amanita thiersii Skay4041 TaxID=703135 RepID=A0A2A9NU99_9AGAR|nr:hypothetical protein AMATHDRAFT_47252 [Amanita thiersii Skay4041]
MSGPVDRSQPGIGSLFLAFSTTSYGVLIPWRTTEFYDPVLPSSTSHPTPLISTSVFDAGSQFGSMVGDVDENKEENAQNDQNVGRSNHPLSMSRSSPSSRGHTTYSSQLAPVLNPGATHAPAEHVHAHSASVIHQGQPHVHMLTHNYPPYNQPSGYFGSYSVPPQHMNLTHTSPPPFSYHPAYHPSHGQTFHYQGHSPEGHSPVHTYPSPGPSPVYPHQVVPQAVSLSSGSAGQHAQHPRFIAAPYHSMHYSSPAMSPPSAYNHPSLNSPPVYQTQYGSYIQHYGSPRESERQPSWWYIHGGQTAPQHTIANSHSTYHGHYTPPYSFSNPRDTDAHRMPRPAMPSQQGAETHGNPSEHPSVNKRLGQQPSHSPGAGHSSSQSESSERVRNDVKRSVDAEKPIPRRSYHPKAPSQRSDWVMWAGNVPSDASEDELWQFFGQLPTQFHSGDSAPSPVVSVFIINRSNCAFINFDTKAHLDEAIEYFNGLPLRPNDSRCPKLVCRVRKKDDDLRAGVGGQRGMGMHTKWIKEQKAKQSSPVAHVNKPIEKGTVPKASEQLAGGLSLLSVSSGDEKGRHRVHAKHSSSSGSYTSTTSSFLSRYFPKRYFILKSLTQYDLDLSTEKGLWATQKHNEGILDQAYRTSQEVYLIFGVNKSREFYGYARMIGPIRSGEPQVPWESRKLDSPPSRASRSPAVSRSTTSQSSVASSILPPSDQHLVDESPQPAGEVDSPPSPVIQSEDSSLMNAEVEYTQTAPAEMVEPHNRFTAEVQPQRFLTELRAQVYTPPRSAVGDAFHLDREAALRAMKSAKGSYSPEEEGRQVETLVRSPEDIKEDGAVDGRENENENENAWGESFKVEWLCTERLPFTRTRHIRNPWNHDREVKVSRDGTELEPTVGQQLLNEWRELAQSAAAK